MDYEYVCTLSQNYQGGCKHVGVPCVMFSIVTSTNYCVRIKLNRKTKTV